MPYFYYNSHGNPMVITGPMNGGLQGVQVYYVPLGDPIPLSPPLGIVSNTTGGFVTSGVGGFGNTTVSGDVIVGDIQLTPSLTESIDEIISNPSWDMPLASPPTPSWASTLAPTPSWALKKPRHNFKEVKNDMKFYNRLLSSIISWSNRSSGEIGLEIECEGKNLDRTLFQYWQCHTDGSLRVYEGHEPVEYVLREPLPRDKVKEALDYLYTKLKEAKAKVVKSQRTSVHVHVNCQKLSVRELFSFICLYLIFEEILVEWSGPDRVGNLFCLRAKDSEFFIQMLEQVLKNENFKSWRDEYRYAACNVASICKFGSLEFRSMQGSIDPEYITTWVNILCMLKDTSLKYDSPVQIVEDFITLGPLPFFKKIFSNDQFRSHLEGIPQLSSKLWDGLRMMRDVAYSCDWTEPKKTDQKEPEQERIKGGDRVARWGMANLPVYVESSGEWTVKDHPLEPAYRFNVPDGHSMYYTHDEWSGGSIFIILEVRQGGPEYREDKTPEQEDTAPSILQEAEGIPDDFGLGLDDNEFEFDEDGNIVNDESSV